MNPPFLYTCDRFAGQSKALTGSLPVDKGLSANQRIRLLALSVRLAKMGPAGRELALANYEALCRRTGKPKENSNGKNFQVKSFLESHCSKFHEYNLISAGEFPAVSLGASKGKRVYETLSLACRVRSC